MTVPAILVVEDNPTTRKLYRLALEAEGYRVLEAFDARSALALATRERPALVLQDLVLPDSDGLALARSLRALDDGVDLPIVAISGFRRLLDRASTEPGLFSGVLAKPVEMAQLLETVRGYAPLRPSAASGRRGASSILVVDDDPRQLKLTRLRLELEGFHVVTASDGTSALETARATAPDAVLCDVLMPGLDGFELCLAMRRDPALSGVPVVLVSAHYGGMRDEDLALRAGASALVLQSPDIEGIVAALRAALAHGPEATLAPQLPGGEHAERVSAQLERQVRVHEGMAERTASHAAQLSILAGVADALARSEDVEEAFGDVLAACLDAGGISRGALYRVDARERLVFGHSIGFPEPLRASLEDAFGYPVLLECATQSAVVFPSAVLPDDDAAQFLERAGATAACLVSLRRHHRCVGALLLASTVNETGEQDLVAFGRAMGAQVAQALAMTNAVDRLRDAAEASRILMSSLDLRATLDAFGALTTRRLTDICEIRLDGAEALVYTASGITGPVRTNLGPAYTLVASLVAHDRPLGTVTLTRVDERRPFEDFDLLVAEDLVQRGAMAIDNARLYVASSESNRLKDEFLTTVSHELRTPLNAILGWSRLLLSGLEERQRFEALRVIERNATAQARLVDDLLDMSRIMGAKIRVQLQRTDVVTSVEAALDTVRPAADLKGVALRAYVPAAPLWTLADPDRLQQIAWNLLSNAIKFTPAGGHVAIEVGREDGALVLRVEDDGQGIDPAFLPYVFERFKQADGAMTRAQGGLGLGLAITRNLAELHGGEVEARSAGKGHGATFIVRLPLRDDVARAASTPDARHADALRESNDLHDLAILVVDDHDDSRELIAAILERSGARPTCVASSAEALEAFARAPPDVLLSDIGMPGEDGYTLIRKIRALSLAEGSGVPAIALSGYARAEDRSLAVSAGYQTHLPKPVDPTELVALVADLGRVARR